MEKEHLGSISWKMDRKVKGLYERSPKVNNKISITNQNLFFHLQNRKKDISSKRIQNI